MTPAVIPGTIAGSTLEQRLSQLETEVRELQSKLDTLFNHYFNINQPRFDYSLNWSLSNDPINY